MTGVCNTPHRADGFAEAISTGSCYIVLETSPPEYVQTISRYLESTVPQIDDTARIEPTESDSGDSVFVTQKPVAEPVRPGKRHHHNTLTTPKGLEESEDDDLFPASPQESTTSKKKKKLKNHTLPKYVFPFIKEKEWMGRRTFLTGQQNTSLHNATMGGFFKCVRELWQGYKGAYMDVSLPTVDMDEDFISPLSEEEGERSEDEDIKVVEKSFLAASKAKCSQPWYNPGKMDDHVKQLSRRRRASNTSQDVSQRDRKKMTNNQGQTKSTSRSVTTATLLLSDTESLGGGYPCRDLPQRETGDKHEIHHTSILGQTETPKTKRRLTGEKKKILFQKSEREEELCNDSDATVCDPLELQRSPGEHTEGANEAITTLMEAQADVLQMDDLNQTGQEEEESQSQSLLQSLPQFVNSVCAESARKKKKKKKAKSDHSAGTGLDWSQEEPEGLHAAASVNMEAEETFSWLDKNGPKHPAMQTCDELENCMKKSTQEKRKRKKSKFIAENVRQEVGENLECGVRLEDSQASVMCNIENVDQVKKKKEKKGGEGVEQLKSPDPAATVNVNDDFDQRKKKKKEKVSTDKREDDGLENTEFTLGSSYKKKKRKHKSVKQSSPLEDAQVDDDAKVNLSNDGATVEEGVVKRKKRRESISEGVSYAPDKSDMVVYLDSQTSIDGPEDQDVKQLTKKKKRREKIGEISNRQASEDTEILKQSDEAASVRKKEKKRTSSFLQADSEKIDDQQQNFRSKSVVAGVCDVEAESAEIYGGVSKKKKKKTLATQGNVEEDHGTDFEEPNKMCGRVLTETGIKKKKKQKRSKSESVASMDRLDGAADEGQSRSDEDIMLKKTKKKKKKKCKEAM